MCGLSRLDSIHGFTVASSSWLMPGRAKVSGVSRLLADVVWCCDRNRKWLSGHALPTLRTIPAPAAEVVGTERKGVDRAKTGSQARLAVRGGQKLTVQTAWPAVDTELICCGREASDQDAGLLEHGRIVSRGGIGPVSEPGARRDHCQVQPLALGPPIWCPWLSVGMAIRAGHIGRKCAGIRRPGRAGRAGLLFPGGCWVCVDHDRLARAGGLSPRLTAAAGRTGRGTFPGSARPGSDCRVRSGARPARRR